MDSWEHRLALARQKQQQYAQLVASQQGMQVPHAPLAQPQQPHQPIGLLNQIGTVANGLGGYFMSWLKSLTPEQQRQYQEAQRLKIERAMQEAVQ